VTAPKAMVRGLKRPLSNFQSVWIIGSLPLLVRLQILVCNSVRLIHNPPRMSRPGRVARKLVKAVLPILIVIVVVVVAVCGWIVYGITRPPRAPYLVTPKSFSTVTGPILNASDVTWKNHDGTEARGWVIRGAEGAPAVILLHSYGADRSWLLNLAVKLNETTNFTVLWPDLRGHGENPPVNWTLFGGPDGDDVTAAIDYLHTLKTGAGKPQVAQRVGVYGIELGSYAALDAARRYPEIRALVLDSVPASPDDLIRFATTKRMGMNNGLLQRLAGIGVRVYGVGKFQATSSCDLARSLRTSVAQQIGRASCRERV